MQDQPERYAKIDDVISSASHTSYVSQTLILLSVHQLPLYIIYIMCRLPRDYILSQNCSQAQLLLTPQARIKQSMRQKWAKRQSMAIYVLWQTRTLKKTSGRDHLVDGEDRKFHVPLLNYHHPFGCQPGWLKCLTYMLVLRHHQNYSPLAPPLHFHSLICHPPITVGIGKLNPHSVWSRNTVIVCQRFLGLTVRDLGLSLR